MKHRGLFYPCIAGAAAADAPLLSATLQPPQGR